MIYVMSDIHGRKDRFEDVLEQINLQENDVLYILGDVIDRNPSGVSLLWQYSKHHLMSGHNSLVVFISP